MKKSDLVDGMKVQYASGGERFISRGKLTLGGVATQQLARYTDDLEHVGMFCSDLNIMKVFSATGELLWDRDASEVVKLHGHPIKVGDRVFSAIAGEGVVAGLYIPGSTYPLEVEFLSDSGATFTQDGKTLEEDIHPSLGWTEEYDVRKLAATKPKKMVKRWQWLMMREVGEYWVTREKYTEESITRSFSSEVVSKIEGSVIEV